MNTNIGRFLKVFGGILLYMVAWGVVLLPIALWARSAGDSGIAVIVLLSMVFLIVLCFVPFLQWLIGRVYFFSGHGDPVQEADLRREILSINDFDVPVMVREKRKTLIVSWKYVDAKWYGIISKSGLKQIYELHVKLNPRTRTARLIDVQKSVSWGVTPTTARIWGGYTRGVDVSYRRGIAYGIKENFRPGKAYDYRFTTSEIKDPVMNTILNSGWSIRFGMW